LKGRDKDCVIVSLVRCNPDRATGRLLADWRRINVAITRARAKLLLVGSAATLAGVPFFAELVQLVRDRGWHLDVPPGALDRQTEYAAQAVSRCSG
jgi:DNA replication ATP-dependent helicase Dna2